MEYLRPGVFVEETLAPLTNTSTSSSDAVAAFVGEHRYGPTDPQRITSWNQFRTIYGGFDFAEGYLAHSVYQYFNNGGRTAYIVRAARPDASPATLTISNDNPTEPVQVLTVTAVSPGAYGNSLWVETRQEQEVGKFTLNVYLGDSADRANLRETFPGLSLQPGASDNAVNIINGTGGSALIRVSSTVPVSDYNPGVHLPMTDTFNLTGGNDGVTAPDLITATQTLGTLPNQPILNLNLPGVSDSGVLSDVITWAEETSDVFVVVDAPSVEGMSSAEATTAMLAMTTGGSALPPSSHVAVYGPWVEIPHPQRRNSTVFVPPGGAVLGVYAATDATRGVAKAPAGVETALKGVLTTQVRLLPGDLDLLNNGSVNVIRMVPGKGHCIMGARTLRPGFPDRYIPIRRALMHIKKGLVDNTQFAIMEPNTPALWASVSAVVSQYLTMLLQANVLKGATPEESFYVKCDEENNPPSSVNVGRVNVEVGVALASPAEFIVIRVGQFDGGAEVTEMTA